MNIELGLRSSVIKIPLRRSLAVRQFEHERALEKARMAENNMKESSTTRKRKKARKDDLNEDVVDQKKPKTIGSILNWDEDADNLLIKFVEEDCEGRRRPKSTLVFARHIDWKAVADKFRDEKSVELEVKDVRGRWEEITKKVRKLRSIPEMLDDVKRNVKLHLDTIPKKPMSSYALFCNSKRPRLVEKYPKMNFIELNQRMAKKWREMPAEKKAKYEQRALKKKEKYEEEMKEWEITNPGAYKVLNGPKKNGHVACVDYKKVTPFEVFCQKKSEEVKQKHPGLEGEALDAKLQKRWEKLKEHKKEKYSEEAEKLNNEQKNTVQSKLHGQKNDGSKPPKKPPSAYNLYFVEKRKELIEKNPKLNFIETAKICSKEWKDISPVEREKFIEQAKKLKDEYMTEHGSVDKMKTSKKATSSKKSKQKTSKKQLSGYTLFFRDARLRLLEENPNLVFGETASLISQEWKKLDPSKIEEYKEKARKLKQDAEKEAST